LPGKEVANLDQALMRRKSVTCGRRREAKSWSVESTEKAARLFEKKPRRRRALSFENKGAKHIKSLKITKSKCFFGENWVQTFPISAREKKIVYLPSAIDVTTFLKPASFKSFFFNYFSFAGSLYHSVPCFECPRLF